MDRLHNSASVTAPDGVFPCCGHTDSIRVFSKSLDKTKPTERECREWANFANF